MINIYELLSSLGISYTVHTHPAVFTVEESQKYDKEIPGCKTKNLFLRNKSGNKEYLVTLVAEKRLDIQKLAEKLGESKLSFASPERLHTSLGLTPGSVSVFGLINDNDHHVSVIVDEDIFKCDQVGYHPNINTSTVVVSTKDLRTFLSWTTNRVEVILMM